MTKTLVTKFLLPAFTVIFLLTGCENIKSLEWPKLGENKTTIEECPVVGISSDLGNITQSRNSQIISETIISSIKPSCTIKDLTETVRLSIDFKGRLGPEGLKDAKNEATYSIPYLIAVIDPKGAIISKDIFAISMVYKQGQTEQSFSDLLEQTIPLKDGEKPQDYKIMIGFQLTEQELAFNRSLTSNGSDDSVSKSPAASPVTITAAKPKEMAAPVVPATTAKSKAPKAVKK